MYRTEAGMLMLCNEEHITKAELSILTIVLGNVTDVKPVDKAKAAESISFTV